MKKLLLMVSLTLISWSGFAQGKVIFNNLASAYLIYTNQDGVSGPTTKTANSFYYALLIANYGGATPSANPLDPAWKYTGTMATNYTIVAGGISGGISGTVVNGWGLPTGNNYDSGTEMYFLIVGWSATLGSTWANISNGLANGLTANGCYGVSPVGYGYAGGGSGTANPLLPPPSLFGITAGMPAGLQAGFLLNGGFTMNSVPSGFALPTPEASPSLLGALGGLCLFGFRKLRRKF